MCLNNRQSYVHVKILWPFLLASKNWRDLRVPLRSSWELRSCGSGKIANIRCVMTQWIVVILPPPEECGSLQKFLAHQISKLFITQVSLSCKLGANWELLLVNTRVAVKIFPPKNLVYIYIYIYIHTHTRYFILVARCLWCCRLILEPNGLELLNRPFVHYITKFLFRE